MITSLDQLDLHKKYSYADYLTWNLRERVELLRGYIRKMTPAPSDEHQRISSFLHGTIWYHLRQKECEVRHAPYDVRLIIPSDTPLSSRRRKSATALSDEEIETVVQPDILVVCDHAKIDDRGCLGAPDLIIEILSRGNNKEDTEEKFTIYESAGVPEYWIVHPFEQTITVYRPDSSGRYAGSRPFAPGSQLTSEILKELEIPVAEVFSRK